MKRKVDPWEVVFPMVAGTVCVAFTLWLAGISGPDALLIAAAAVGVIVLGVPLVGLAFLLGAKLMTQLIVWFDGDDDEGGW